MKTTENPMGTEMVTTPETSSDFPGEANNPAVSKSIPAVTLEIVSPVHGSRLDPCAVGDGGSKMIVPASGPTFEATLGFGSKPGLGATIQWASSLEGSLGSGRTISACLSIHGVHTISATLPRPGKPPLTATVNVVVAPGTDPTDSAGGDLDESS